jgi:hypothetical protein
VKVQICSRFLVEEIISEADQCYGSQDQLATKAAGLPIVD